jgi:hypothetical protein
MKIVIVLGFLAILASLAAALYGIVRDKGHSSRTVWAPTYRVGLSIALFILLWIAQACGWIQPHGIVP